MNNNTIKKVVFLGALTIIAIIGIQSYWVMRTWDIKDQEFHQSVQIALRKVAKGLVELNEGVLPANNLIRQLSSNYYVVNIEDNINAAVLEHYLQKELEAVNLNIDFEYAIHDCTSKEMVYGNYCSYSELTEKDLSLGELPTYNEFTYYFGVKFPTRSSHFMESMQLAILFTGILLLAVLFFIYSMLVILRQRRLSEMQKDFINNMTHEFKTPISTIKISADVFLENEDIKKDSRLYQYAKIIQAQNQRLNNQVEKVLQLAKVERDSFQLALEEIDLHQLLQTTLESVRLKVEQDGGTLRTDFQAERAIIQADQLHLTNILHNLLDNALKYCKKNPHLVLTTSNVGKDLLLKITDQGIGISKEHQAKVFKKFYRVPTGNVHNVKGFGLGLFYIKNVCDAHHWKLKLESELDAGTTISIQIPNAKTNF
ncbi:MAG: sensor histidine kinase [Saprospiraceae bacterium]